MLATDSARRQPARDKKTELSFGKEVVGVQRVFFFFFNSINQAMLRTAPAQIMVLSERGTRMVGQIRKQCEVRTNKKTEAMMVNERDRNY